MGVEMSMVSVNCAWGTGGIAAGTGAASVKSAAFVEHWLTLAIIPVYVPSDKPVIVTELSAFTILVIVDWELPFTV